MLRRFGTGGNVFELPIVGVVCSREYPRPEFQKVVHRTFLILNPGSGLPFNGFDSIPEAQFRRFITRSVEPDNHSSENVLVINQRDAIPIKSVRDANFRLSRNDVERPTSNFAPKAIIAAVEFGTAALLFQVETKGAYSIFVLVKED